MDPKWKPCADMTLTTTLLSNVNDNTSTITVSFDEMIDVSKEVIAFTFFQMVAEVKGRKDIFSISSSVLFLSIKVGGFIALILGISFMDLMRVAELFKDKMMNKWAEQK